MGAAFSSASEKKDRGGVKAGNEPRQEARQVKGKSKARVAADQADQQQLSSSILRLVRPRGLHASGKLDKGVQVHIGAAGHVPSRPRARRWKKGDPIGSGSFGTVYLGLNCDTGM
jgi:hypothetical protein